MNPPRFVIRIPRRMVSGFIYLYQKTLSPDHGPFKNAFPYGVCRFLPTCSVYARQAIEEYGIFKGGWMSMRRIGRCHPWHPGGEDPVPKREE